MKSKSGSIGWPQALKGKGGRERERGERERAIVVA